MPGKLMRERVRNSTSFAKPDHCGRVDCVPCVSSISGSKGTCWMKSPVYQIECGSCKQDGQVATYVGESGFSSYTRGANHRAGLRKENQQNAMWSDAVEHHRFSKGQGGQVE